MGSETKISWHTCGEARLHFHGDWLVVAYVMGERCGAMEYFHDGESVHWEPLEGQVEPLSEDEYYAELRQLREAVRVYDGGGKR